MSQDMEIQLLKKFKKGKKYDHPCDMEEVRKGNNNTK
jgi:hypothetical protein